MLFYPVDIFSRADESMKYVKIFVQSRYLMGVHPHQYSNLLLNPNLQFKHSILQSKLSNCAQLHARPHKKGNIALWHFP